MIKKELSQSGDSQTLDTRGKQSLLRVVLCDDDERFLNQIHYVVKDLLDKSNIPSRIHAFSDPSTIGGVILQSCDIAILDIDFSGVKNTGIDIAKQIRNLRQDTIIIFLTNYVEYAPEGYEVQAFRYLLKNDVNKKMPEYLRQAVERFQKIRNTVKITVYGEIIDIPIENISYIEMVQHQAILHVCSDNGEKQYSYYNSLSNLEDELKEQGFLRTHRSYLVNMSHIKTFLYEGITLSNGTQLRVSGKTYATQKKAYMLWKGMY